jgi:hypothetical protein
LSTLYQEDPFEDKMEENVKEKEKRGKIKGKRKVGCKIRDKLIKRPYGGIRKTTCCRVRRQQICFRDGEDIHTVCKVL